MNDKITMQICEKTMSGDFNTELSMPDYEPEIRRLLRVGVTLTPPAGFFDTSRIGMNGEIIYDILYAGNDGALYSTRTSESYELAEAFKPNEKNSDITSIVCEITPESLVSRATAPRKLSLRCKLRGHARALGEQEITERATYIEDPNSVERLQDESEYAYIFPSAFAEARISDDFAAELPSGVSGDIRIISHTACAVCEDVEPANDEAVVKGTLHLSMLATVDDGESAPFKLSRKIPFAETVDMNELTPLCKCIASACCTECDFTLEENRVFCEPVLLIKLDAEEIRRAEYTKDIFSTDVASETTSKRYEFPVSEKNFSGNFTVSTREEVEALGIDPDSEIIDTTASAVVKNVEFDRNKWALVGETVMNFLTKSNGEYSVKEIKTPFKYEISGNEIAPFFTDCRVVALSPRAKTDGTRLLCDCELHACGRIYAKSGFEAIDEVIFGEPLERDSAITVCFPSPTDTLWDVSKRYHIPTDTINSQESRLRNGEAVIFDMN